VALKVNGTTKNGMNAGKLEKSKPASGLTGKYVNGKSAV
jgi:hypothetical protein